MHVIVAFLQGGEVQQEVALALLQNLSLHWPCHSEIQKTGFVTNLAKFVGRSC